MFDIGSIELLLVFVIMLLVVGPKRLPELAYMLGSLIANIRQFINKLKHETEMDKHIHNFKKQTGLDEYDHSLSAQSITQPLNREVQRAKQALLGQPVPPSQPSSHESSSSNRSR